MITSTPGVPEITSSPAVPAIVAAKAVQRPGSGTAPKPVSSTFCGESGALSVELEAGAGEALGARREDGARPRTTRRPGACRPCSCPRGSRSRRSRGPASRAPVDLEPGAAAVGEADDPVRALGAGRDSAEGHLVLAWPGGRGAVAEQDRDAVGAEVRDREVLAAVAVEVAGGDGVGVRPVVKSVFAPNVPFPWPSRTETVFEFGFATARSSRAVGVEVAGGDGAGSRARREVGLRPERAVPLAEQDRDGVRVEVRDREVLAPVVVEVAGGDGERESTPSRSRSSPRTSRCPGRGGPRRCRELVRDREVLAPVWLKSPVATEWGRVPS